MPKSIRKLRVYLNVDQRIRKLRLESIINMVQFFAGKMDEVMYKHITGISLEE